MLFDTLRECNAVVSFLDLANNKIDDECMRSLGEYIQCNCCLEEFSLDSNQITDRGIETLSEYVIGNTGLKAMQLDAQEGITDASAQLFVDIARSTYISRLNLKSQSISEEKMKQIEEALHIPTDHRDIPIKSSSKSAAKISCHELKM